MRTCNLLRVNVYHDPDPSSDERARPRCPARFASEYHGSDARQTRNEQHRIGRRPCRDCGRPFVVATYLVEERSSP